MTQLEFYYDFGSPNAYLAYKVLPGVIERSGAELVLKPALLGGIFKATNNQSPFIAMAGITGKLAYEQLEIRRFIQKHDLTAFTMNQHFPVNTLTVMRAAVAADEDGDLEPYTAAVMAAMWEQSEKMDDPETIERVLTGAGLDGASLLERAGSPPVKEALIAHTGAAVERGIFGLPAFFIGDEMWFGKDRLGQVEDHLKAQK